MENYEDHIRSLAFRGGFSVTRPGCQQGSSAVHEPQLQGRFWRSGRNPTASGFLCGGATWYLDRAKSWHLALAGFYEIHSEKRDTDIRVGDILTLEGGFGKSFLDGAFTVGIAYDAQWKITEDDPGSALQPIFDQRGIGKHRVYGVGPELTVPIATKRKLYGFVTARYMFDFGARNTLEGNSFVIMASLPIPPVSLE